MTSQEPAQHRAAVDPEQWLHMYQQMCKIRAFEENANDLYTSAKMPGITHLYIGEEAIAVGVCEALRVDDYITSTHRGHGHCLAKGASVTEMFAELLGKEAGPEGYQSYGVTAEIAAVIADGAFYHLDAPVKRLGAMDVPIPFSPVLEDLTIPNASGVVEAAKVLCGRL